MSKKLTQESIFLRDIQHLIPVLYISFEVDDPTGKVGSSLLFVWRRRELFRGVWEHAPPQKILKFRCLEMVFVKMLFVICWK